MALLFDKPKNRGFRIYCQNSYDSLRKLTFFCLVLKNATNFRIWNSDFNGEMLTRLACYSGRKNGAKIS